METIEITAKYLSNGSTTNIYIPKCCPRCGVANNPTTSIVGNYSNVYAFTHYCPACNQYHFTMQAIRLNTGKPNEMLLVHPQYTSSKLPTLVATKFPKASKMFSDAEYAENNGALELAGMGYRAFCEYLIKDYALLFELDDYENIAKQNLNNAISKYLKDDPLISNVADVIRIVGNDFTHWDSTTDVDLVTLKFYADILLNWANIRLSSKFPPVSR